MPLSVSTVIKKEESLSLSPFWYQKTRRPNLRSTAHYLVYATLPLVLVLAEPLAGSHHTILPRPPTASHFTGEAIRLT